MESPLSRLRSARPPTSRHRRARLARRAAAGFSLLEVLVAVVVLSFGVLGVVGLQAASLQANKQAKYQSAAVRLGRELGDMMRGNPTIATQTSASANPYLVDFSGVVVATATDCSAAICATPLDVANFEMSDWLRRAVIDLPGARVVVCPDDAPYDASGVPRWTCAGSTKGIFVIKIGWTRESFNRGSSGPGVEKVTGGTATGKPGVVLPLIPVGS